ncbi:MAG: ATP-dependent RNA helicase HrpA [Actinomycetaceae bacterium]|nr:ATP-dependent RNA helicase HrpA [Actinomycetaceae bacterium]
MNPLGKSRADEGRRESSGASLSIEQMVFQSQFPAQQLAARAACLPAIRFPQELPVSARRDDIARSIRDHQVTIISGETGSGKTTQIPKICLQLGLGIRGMIGHTQPRRLAARTVADRIAEELGTRVGNQSGDVVGFQVRFTDEVGPTTLVKLMTDGILLAEIQHDPELRKYDTIIIDEAHERSLNIDFLIGYLKRLLPRRPDLKVIITSATIDSARFAEHFSDTNGKPAPIIEVSGRTYPVEVRYRPLSSDVAATMPADSHETSGSIKNLVLEDADYQLATEGYGLGDDIDYLTATCAAVDELCGEGDGDILVFLPGERDIRDTNAALKDHLGNRFIAAGEATSKSPLNGIEVLPLFSRLSAREQRRVFEQHPRRRVVLATNVAETSLTVPGIRYVIDPGLARISRYSNRTKVQRLPIEPVSQASANQRSGRCGRVADGIAIRLYSQRDFNARPEYTEPEILRTSLASVILQMVAIGLGDPQDFPFLDAPNPKAIRDGIALLDELGAVRGGRSQQLQLTRVGRQLSRLPIDPRLGRMLIEAERNGCTSDVLIIVAALSMQDVRERPEAFQEDSDRAHARFLHPTSDFITYLNLWRYLRTMSRDLSNSAFRRLCRREFLHYLRFREWQDVVGQLTQLARPLKLHVRNLELPRPTEINHHARTGGQVDAAARACVELTNRTSARNADSIHQSLLVGLLSNIGTWDQQRSEYEGARGTKFVIWPGSGLARKHYEWVMAAELVETSRLFARTVAKIDPAWVEPLAGKLAKKSYSEPYWSTRNAAAMVREKVMLYGLTIIAERPVLLGNLPANIRIDTSMVGASSIGARTTTFAPGLRGSTPKELARDMFIQHALVEEQWRGRYRFIEHNRQVLDEIHEDEKKLRHGGTVSDDTVFAFYDERLPESVISAGHFNRWFKRQRNKNVLLLSKEMLLPDASGHDPSGYPSQWRQGELALPLRYEFDPGSVRDGITVRIPVSALARVRDEGFEWLVPGMLEELITATIRALPKQLRAQLVPAPDAARSLGQWIRENIWGERQSESTPQSASREYAQMPDRAQAAKNTDETTPSTPGTTGNEPDPRSLEASLSRLAAWAAKSQTASAQSIEKMRRAAETSQKTPVSTQQESPREKQSPSIHAPAYQGRPGTSEASLPHFFDALCDAARAVKGVEIPRDVWDSLDLPSHVRPMFTVVDEAGRELRSGEDLTWLKKQLKGTSQQAVRSAMRDALDQAIRDHRKDSQSRHDIPSLAHVSAGARDPESSPARSRKPRRETSPAATPISEQNDLVDWPELTAPNDALPVDIEATTDAGLTVRAYPGLVPQGEAQNPRAGVRIAAEKVEAHQLHREGLARLVLASTALTTSRVSTRWTGKQALVLAASPYATTEELVAQAQLAAVRSLIDEFATAPDHVRNRSAFNEVTAWIQDRIEDRTYRVLEYMVDILTEYRALDRTIRQGSTQSTIRLIQSVRTHIDSLVNDKVLARTPYEWLPHLPRYVKAARLRIDKATESAVALSRDEGNEHSIRDIEDALDKALENTPAHDVKRRQALVNGRWLLEELRVSLFAQELGTSRKVSIKRMYDLLHSAGKEH